MTLNDVDILQSINNSVSVNAYSKSEIGIGLNLKSDKFDTYPKYEATVALSIVQAGIDRRVLINAVDSNGTCKLNATATYMLKIQRVDGSLVYDAFELSFDIADKTSVLKNNINILESLKLRAFASNVFTKQELIGNDIIYDNALNTKADKSTSYTRTEIMALIETQCTFTAPLQRSVDRSTGILTISISPNTLIHHMFSNRVDIQPPAQLGGCIRIIPALNSNGASIAYYNCIDARWTTTGDAWVCGVNCWDNQAYSIGTPVLNNYFSININGNVDIPCNVHTPEIMVDSIKSLVNDQTTINDNVILPGDIIINGRCNMFNNLRVLGTSEFGNTISIQTP